MFESTVDKKANFGATVPEAHLSVKLTKTLFMKYIVLTLCFSVLISSFQSCKKNRPESITFDYEKAAGIWVPCEVRNGDGSIANGPFFASTIFGVYAESVKLNKDGTFIPIQWQSKTNFTLKATEKGTYQYLPLTKKLIFDGVFHDEYIIAEFSNDELWLESGPVVRYKYKREL